MGLTLLILATCIGFGAIAYFAAKGPLPVPNIRQAIRETEPKRFSPKNTLFIIGPSPNHNPCRLQRRLLKPAIAALISEDVAVIEVYGDMRPTKNGEKMEWLDASLLRHAMNAEDGFYVVYVDQDGKTGFRSEAPMLARDIIERAKLGALRAPDESAKKKSAVLKKLRAA